MDMDQHHASSLTHANYIPCASYQGSLSLSLHLLLHNFLFDEFLASLGTSGVLAFGEISRQ
jgi:hypothetical protein